MLVTITAPFLLIILLESIEGNKEVFNITCDDQPSGGGEEESYSSGIGSGVNLFPYNYCINDICFYDQLENVTSNSIINIICDVKLASIIKLVNLTNVSLTGYNNPTISCSNDGGLHFLFCHNINIKGITWEGCDSSVANPGPVIKLENSSAITIANCSFQHLVGQAVMLTELSRDVSIDYCMFVNNSGHHNNSVMFYSSASSIGKLSISNSNFESNKGYESIVYLKSSQDDTGCHYLLENSTFIDNGKMLFYFDSVSLHMNNILFEENSRMLSAENSKLYFEGNSDIHIVNYNQRQNFPFFLDFSTVTFRGHSRMLFKFGTSAIALYNYSIFTFEDSSNVTFINNYYSKLIYLENYSSIGFRGNSTVCFIGNRAAYDGGAIYSQSSSSITFEGNSRVSFSNNIGSNGGGIYSQGSCSVTFKGNTEVSFSYNTATEGGAIYILDHSKAIVEGNSKVILYDNGAYFDGGAIFSESFSVIIFTGNSTVTFKNNRGENAGALRGRANSNMTFDENTNVFFMNNHASHNGGAMDLFDNANVVFKGNCTVKFDNNTADSEDGGACTFHSTVSFIDNATVNFVGNNAGRSGGAIALNSNFNVASNIFFSNSNCGITFEGNSRVSFSNNIGSNGGGIHSQGSCSVTFKGNTEVSFSYNIATDGGAIFILDHSEAIIEGNSKVILYDNKASGDGGAIFSKSCSVVIFTGNSTVTFKNNRGVNAGALRGHANSNMTFDENTNVLFMNNHVSHNGGAMDLYDNANVVFKGNCTVTFDSNTADSEDGGAGSFYSAVSFIDNATVNFIGNNAGRSGGAIALNSNFNVASNIFFSNSNFGITFEGNSRVLFSNNIGSNGGGIYSQGSCSVTFKGNTEVSFSYNTATDGGAIYILDHSEAVVEGNSKVMLYNNKASGDGGAIFSKLYSMVIFTANSTVTFKNNRGVNAGALQGHANSNMTFDENTNVFFMNNSALHNGGAMYLYDNANVVFKGNSIVTFYNNIADLEDGSACTFHSTVSFIDNATVNFTRNNAGSNGGAIALHSNFNVTFEKSNIFFSSNSAKQCGGAVLGSLHQGDKVNFDMQNAGTITFHNNIALTGNSMLVDVKETCNKSCFNGQAVGITDINDVQQPRLTKHIATSPYKIVLQTQQQRLICERDDAYKRNSGCMTNISDVMLGHNVNLKGLLYDYLDNPIPILEPFEIFSDMTDENYISQIQQNIYQDFDISIIGNKIISTYKYSFIIRTYYVNCLKEWHYISQHFSIQLSPCHHGFQHNNESKRCECYDRDSIVSCAGATSTIRRGHWLGTVEGKLTTSICPINYCNFTCCETTNGYHSLSPGRENQCTSHRSGIACGSCEEGYTLSYAAECVSVDRCKAGWTVLVVILTMIYWIVIVIGVFAMMYYKLPIGYLYAITYYYSMVDVLLGQYSYIYSSLHTTINILSSIFKLAPEVLGELCLARGLSGIDTQFIQYVHPLAISIILIIISLVARCSQRLSLFIARGIIHVICFLLLLSYTSMVSTSLLLLRSLQFYDVDKIYTYLSPDIEYFHGRHLAYFIVALMFVITIIIGLPLTLLLEPFLNRKINFTRFKPLLDQFQGCYKNRCRWFAAYYMICRLVQITTVVYSSDYFVTQYILTATNVIVSLVHIIVRPYNNIILNVFDGVILQLMVFVSVVPVFDTIHTTVLVTAAFILVIVPLPILLIMGFIIHKETIRKLINSCNCRAKLKNTRVTAGDNSQNEKKVQEFDIIVDESMRTNATICDV